jgi:hypothetical protein
VVVAMISVVVMVIVVAMMIVVAVVAVPVVVVMLGGNIGNSRTRAESQECTREKV